MRRTLLAVPIAVALLLPSLAAAQDDPVVTARVDATRIGEGDSLTLTIEVRGSLPGTIEEPDLSGLADFTVAAGPSISTSTSMIWQGGRATSSTSKQFSFALLPRHRGTLTIPTVSVKVGNRIRRTDPITVEVVEGRVRPPSTSGQRGRGGPLGPGGGGAAELPEGEIMVESRTDRTEAFVGEQILLTYTLFTQLEVVEMPSPQQLPSYTGFWVEEIPTDPRNSIRKVTRGGKEFVAITLMKKALFPTSSGTLTIDATAFGLPVKARSRDPFDSIFFTPTRTVYRQTRPISIRVKPLPEKGRPESFNGAVGRYSLSVESDRRETRVSEALDLKVTVTGEGNIRVVGEPLLPPLPDYKKYEPHVEEQKKISGDRIEGSRSWDYVLTPLAPGQQDIPPIRFAYFDPERAAYVEVSGPAIPVRVQKGEESPAAAGVAQGGGREVTAFNRDIRYIKPPAALGASGAPYHRSIAFAATLGAPLLLNAGLLLFVRRRERMEANLGLVRGRRAPGFARRRLRAARRLLAAGNSREFHQEIARALAGYLGDKLDMSPAGLTHEAIEALLQRRGVEPAVRTDLQGCLERCDYARFAPVAPGRPEMEALMEDAGQVIGRLERALSSRRKGRGAA